METVSQLDDQFQRWPLNKEVYNHVVGALLPRIIKKCLLSIDYNFDVWINPSQGNDVDLILRRNKEIVLVSEIINWSKRSRLTPQRYKRIKYNLYKYKASRLFIYSQIQNIEDIKTFDFDTIELGYQVLPYDFYQWFAIQGLTKGRKCYSAYEINSINYDIRRKLETYLEKKGLLHI